MLVIIDYGMGNIRSVEKVLIRIGVEYKISSSLNDIETAEKLILPGVGHFKNGIENLKQKNIYNILNKKILENKTPILGICLGMQLFTKHSEEGNLDGFGWVDATTKKFNVANHNLKTPHMGWNNLNIKKKPLIFEGVLPENSFYFVHSYFVKCNDNEDVLSTTEYGEEFVSSFQKNNIYGVQFHPEKSHSAGLHILNNFCKNV